MLKTGLIRVLDWIDPPPAAAGPAVWLDAAPERPDDSCEEHLRRAAAVWTDGGATPAEAFRRVRLALNAVEQSWSGQPVRREIERSAPLSSHEPRGLALRSRAALALVVSRARERARRVAA